MDIEFYIDIHAHSTLMNGFMYGNIYDDLNRFDHHMLVSDPPLVRVMTPKA